jgi:hypothetical protein
MRHFIHTKSNFGTQFALNYSCEDVRVESAILWSSTVSVPIQSQYAHSRFFLVEFVFLNGVVFVCSCIEDMKAGSRL